MSIGKNLVAVTARAIMVTACAIMIATLAVRSAYAQTPADGEPSSGAMEQELRQRYPNQWANLTPDHRERVIENYQRRKQMTPEERSLRGRTIRSSGVCR